MNSIPFPPLFGPTSAYARESGFRAIMGCFALSMLISPPCRADEVPQELADLNEAYQGAQERALEPLKATYLTQLELLLDKLTKQGRLDEALMVKNMLKETEEGPKEQTEEPVEEEKPPRGVTKTELASARDLLGEWIVNHRLDDVLTLDERKNATFGRERGEWGVSLTFTASSEGTRFIIKPNERTDEILASSYDEATKLHTPIILTRKKE